MDSFITPVDESCLFCHQVEDDSDFGEFLLQYACGRADGRDNTKLLFHTVYEGPSTSFTVKNLRTCAPYSFRVRGRCDKCAPWSSWSLSHVAATTIPHHRMFTISCTYSWSCQLMLVVNEKHCCKLKCSWRILFLVVVVFWVFFFFGGGRTSSTFCLFT